MASLTTKVRKKLEEYGIEIFNDYQIDKTNEYVFYAENMIIFVSETEPSISITFQATAKPERSATLALILNEIPKTPINIMEPFIFDQNNKFVSGEAAYKLIEKVDKTKIAEEYRRQKVYEEILQNTEGFEC